MRRSNVLSLPLQLVFNGPTCSLWSALALIANVMDYVKQDNLLMPTQNYIKVEKDYGKGPSALFETLHFLRNSCIGPIS
jgi:hypothetical protein